MGWSFACVLIAGLWLTLPSECYVLSETLWLKIKILFLNAYLLVRAWLFYSKLKADLGRMQITAPPFHFVPIQDRN
jgi:uncharacterized membrane protein SirB2